MPTKKRKKGIHTGHDIPKTEFEDGRRKDFDPREGTKKLLTKKRKRRREGLIGGR